MSASHSAFTIPPREITIHIQQINTTNFPKHLAEWLRILNTIYAEGKRNYYTISFQKCSFLSPLIILPLVLSFYKLNRDGYNISFDLSDGNIDSNVKAYLGYINFPEGIEPEKLSIDEYEKFLSKFTSKTYIPIVNLPEEKTNESAEIRDKFRTCIHSLISHQCKLSGQVKSAVIYLIDEALNNISEHSQSERGFVFAQYYSELKCLHVGIGDTGVSIYGSYQSCGIKEVDTYAKSIEYAIDGVTTKSTAGRGFGIKTSKKMLINGLKGSYLLYSGMAFNLHTSERDEINESPVFYGGTCLLLVIPLNPEKQFSISSYLE